MEHHVDLQGDYGQKVLSYYLWGMGDKPDDIVKEYYIDRSEKVTIEFSAKEYIEKFYNINGANLKDGILRYAKEFNIFELFFNSKGLDKQNLPLNFDYLKNNGSVKNISDNVSEIAINHEQFVNMYYSNSKSIPSGETKSLFQKALEAELATNLYDDNLLTGEEYAKSALVFGSTKFTINTSADVSGIRYIFKAIKNDDGTIIYEPDRIENLQISPMDDNFDFISKDGFAGAVNPLLDKIFDPNGIGKKVNIKFASDFYPGIGKKRTYYYESRF